MKHGPIFAQFLRDLLSCPGKGNTSIIDVCRFDFEKCLFLADVDFTYVDDSIVSFIDCWKIASPKYQQELVNLFEDFPPMVAIEIACFCGERVDSTFDLIQQEFESNLSKWTIE